MKELVYWTLWPLYCPTLPISYISPCDLPQSSSRSWAPWWPSGRRREVHGCPPGGFPQPPQSPPPQRLWCGPPYTSEGWSYGQSSCKHCSKDFSTVFGFIYDNISFKRDVLWIELLIRLQMIFYFQKIGYWIWVFLPFTLASIRT